MGLGETVLAVGAGGRPASFEQFSAAIDPAWIAEVLAATGTASVRRRKLPAEHVVWLVIGMGLFHDRSIAQVVQHLDLVLPARNGGQGRVSNAAIVQARDQLGAKPLAALFAQTATVWATTAADATRWRGLAVYGLDGTTLRVADTPENVAHFGRPGSRHGEGAGYPQLRLAPPSARTARASSPWRPRCGGRCPTARSSSSTAAFAAMRCSTRWPSPPASATGWSAPKPVAPRSRPMSSSASAPAITSSISRPAARP